MAADTLYIKQYRARRKQEAMKFLGGACTSCGSDQELEFDHKNPELKLFNISGYTGSKEKFWKEVNKCQLLCSKCHKIKTKKTRVVEKRCGTVAAYKDGCRCQSCKLKMSESRKRWNMKYRGRV